VYGAPWFAALGLLLAANIAACAFSRGKGARLHYVLLHAGLVVVIAGAFVTRLRRFEAQLPLHKGAAAELAQTASAAYRLPFSVELEDFRIDYYAEPMGRLVLEEGGARKVFDAKEGLVLRPAAGGTVKVLRLVKDFGLTAKNEVVEKSPYWFNPAVQVELVSGGKKKKLWFFSNFPGMHGGSLPFELYYSIEQAEIKGFTSAVVITSADGKTVRGEIGVNRPLKFGGYTLYQTSYDPADAAYSLLTVTMDRGAWVVYAGFGLVLIGVLLWLRK
jgi:cytochrome c biogenesis protein ResB